MKRRSRTTWLVYAACSLLLVDTLGWATWQGLRLEESERLARERTEREQAARLALWRMESVVTPLLARESVRPYFHYWPEYAAEQPYATAWLITPASVRASSPLRNAAPDATAHWLRLHFQQTPDGRVMVPAADGDPTNPETARATRGLMALRTILQPVAESGTMLASGAAQTRAQGERQQRDEGTAPQDSFSEMVSAEPAGQIPPAQTQEDDESLAARQAIVKRSQVPNVYSYNTKTEDLSQNLNWLSPQELDLITDGDQNAPEFASTVSVGPFHPRWLPTTDPDELVFEREVDINGATYTQGLWIDWRGLRAELLAETVGVLPEASLIPVRSGDVTSPDTLATVPARLVINWPDVSPPKGLTPLRLALFVSWIAVATGLIAIGLVLRAAVRLSERRARFVSAVTHELRTPLTGFRLHADLLASGRLKDEDARVRTASTVKQEAERLSDVVESVLAAARLDQGQPPRTGETPIEHFDAVLRPRLEGIAERSGFTFKSAIDADPGTTLAIAPADLERIVVNLVDNACKHGKPKDPTSTGAVRVGVVTDKGVCRITVADNGPGIADASRSRIFQEFERGPGSETVGGMGLGLALARRLAHGAGGDLVLTDHKGPGAVFELRIPLSRNSA